MKLHGALGVCVAVALLGACGGDDDDGGGGAQASGCGTAPLACPADQTCWPVNATGHLACTSAPADQTQGKTCTLIAGQATCAPGLYCFPTATASATGTCEPFCSEAGCSNGGICVQVGIVGGTEFVPVCMPPSTDGGIGGSGGTAGTGSGGTAGTASGGTAGTASGGTAGSGGTSGSAGDGG